MFITIIIIHIFSRIVFITHFYYFSLLANNVGTILNGIYLGETGVNNILILKYDDSKNITFARDTTQLTLILMKLGI